MNVIIKCVSVLLILISISSCSDNSQNGNNIEYDENFKYPYSLNSFWYYSTKNAVINIRPDSLRQIYNGDTITGYGIASFINDTVIENKNVKILKNEYSLDGHSSMVREYFEQTDSGLIRLASLSSGSNLSPFRGKYNYYINGKYFNSLNELSFGVKNDLQPNDSTVILDNPPVMTLKYPLEINYEWELINNGFVRILKKYSGFENINISGKNFHCMKISRNYYFSSNLPDENFITTDYFAAEGIVRRDLLIKNINVVNEIGTLLGYIDLSEKTTVNLYSIP
ncbi:MAG: hypothetical protein WAT71_04885 [Ignavibacteria bacterium]